MSGYQVSKPDLCRRPFQRVAFAKDLNLTKPGGTGLIAIMNGKRDLGTILNYAHLPAASVPGLTLIGLLSDRFPLVWVLGLTCAGSSLSCFFLWGFGTTNALLIAFVIVYGVLGLSLTALGSKMISIICRKSVTGTIAGLTVQQLIYRRRSRSPPICLLHFRLCPRRGQCLVWYVSRVSSAPLIGRPDIRGSTQAGPASRRDWSIRREQLRRIAVWNTKVANVRVFC